MLYYNHQAASRTKRGKNMKLKQTNNTTRQPAREPLKTLKKLSCYHDNYFIGIHSIHSFSYNKEGLTAVLYICPQVKVRLATSKKHLQHFQSFII